MFKQMCLKSRSARDFPFIAMTVLLTLRIL